LLKRKQIKTNADIVTGSRYLSGGGIEIFWSRGIKFIKKIGVYGWPFMRRLVSRGANFGASFVLGSPCSDLTGSCR